MPGKLRSRWTGPYTIVKVWPYGAVELKNDDNGHVFKVNGQRVKIYLGGPVDETEEFDLGTPEFTELESTEIRNNVSVISTIDHEELQSIQVVTELGELLDEYERENPEVASCDALNLAQHQARVGPNSFRSTLLAQPSSLLHPHTINNELFLADFQNPNHSQNLETQTLETFMAANQSSSQSSSTVSRKTRMAISSKPTEVALQESAHQDYSVRWEPNPDMDPIDLAMAWSGDNNPAFVGTLALEGGARVMDEISDSGIFLNNTVKETLITELGRSKNETGAEKSMVRARPVVLALPAARNIARPRPIRMKAPVCGPIRRRTVPKKYGCMVVHSDSSSDDGIPFAPRSESPLSDPSEPDSGSEHDYNDPEACYMMKSRVAHSQEESKGYSSRDYGYNAYNENSSREGYDDDWEWGNQVAKEERWAHQIRMKEEAARMYEEVEEEYDELDDIIILSVPERKPDPGSFTIPISIKGTQFLRCLVDSGSARNVMTEVTYRSLAGVTLIPFDGRLRFGNHETTRPLGSFVVNVLVEGYPVPTEFVVIRTNEKVDPFPRVVIGRPFMATARAFLDLASNELTLNLPNVTLRFNQGGTLVDRQPHNRTAREERAEPRARTHARPSLGGWRGRGRGR